MSPGKKRLFPISTNSPLGRLIRQGLTWTVVVCVSAIPSLVFAAHEYDAAGMLCGMAIFIAIYTIASMTAPARRLVEEPFVKRTMFIGYGLRMSISVIYPIGFAFDLIPGIVAVGIVEHVFGKARGFTPTLCTTLLQGAFVNVLLGAFLLFVYLLQRIFSKPPIKEGCCQSCGYDLRVQLAQRIPKCPECGTPVPSIAA